VVNSDIEQIVEMREEKDRFLRALELLGEWYERGKIILFVSSQEKCDRVFRDLLRAGYPCLSLHGGKEQSDRECTVADFKSDVCNILVATSVAARGLDVKDLRLVINYDTPNHLEDYVHRVGRTGRAGNKGTAVTFISEEEERFAPDLVKAMTDARRAVPADLREMAERYDAKRKKGAGEKKRGGFGGSGFAFSREERDAERRARKAAAQAAGVELDDDAFSDDARNALVGVRSATPPPRRRQRFLN
jgi:ATP-dependent RNA helicase DDX46/PRP5